MFIQEVLASPCTCDKDDIAEAVERPKPSSAFSEVQQVPILLFLCSLCACHSFPLELIPSQ